MLSLILTVCLAGAPDTCQDERPPVEPQYGNRLGRQGRRLPKADEWPAAVAELIPAEGDAERALERLWPAAQVQNATMLIGADLCEPVREREAAETREVRGLRAAVTPVLTPLPARRPWPRGGAGRTALATAQHQGDLERRAVLVRAQVFHARRCRPVSHVRPPQEPWASALRAP